MKRVGWCGVLVAVLGIGACSKEPPTPTQDASSSTTTSAPAAATSGPVAEAVPPAGGSAAAADASEGAGRPAVTTGATSTGSGALALKSGAPAPSAAPSATVEVAPEPPPVEGTKASAAQYAAFLAGPKKVKAGSPVALAAVFTATGEYHCNEKFPASFKPDAAPDGVTFTSDKFSSAAFTAKRSTIPVALTTTSAGTKRVSGTLKFGVCNESECIPVKVPVSFAFDVE